MSLITVSLILNTNPVTASEIYGPPNPLRLSKNAGHNSGLGFLKQIPASQKKSMGLGQLGSFRASMLSFVQPLRFSF